MTEPVNHFARLSAINVSDHIEKKGGFSYLSWPYAVSQLRLADPSAVWEVRRFNGLPHLASEAGVFVEVAVTVQGITLNQIHPVLDGRNRPLIAPTAVDINSSIQRCLVKAIALHGLGLYIYAGEDLRNRWLATRRPPMTTPVHRRWNRSEATFALCPVLLWCRRSPRPNRPKSTSWRSRSASR